MNRSRNSQSIWITGLQWVLSSTAGFIVSALASLVLTSYRLLPAPQNSMLYVFIYAMVAAIPVSVMQWFVLRRELEGTAWWIPISILGYMIGYLANRLLIPYLPTELTSNTALAGALTGLCIGACQLIFLWRYFSWAPLWILATSGGWALHMTIGNRLWLSNDTLIVAAAQGIAIGIVTATVLVFLLSGARTVSGLVRT